MNTLCPAPGASRKRRAHETGDPQLLQEEIQTSNVVPRQRGRRGCQVCGAIEKEVRYYKRFHICRKHANLPSLELGGRLVRFCQQCGRFHELSAFDAERKSCRQALQAHAQRRRKTHKPDSCEATPASPRSQPWQGATWTKRQASDASTLSGMAPFVLPLEAELPSPAPAVPDDNELAHQAQQGQRQPQQQGQGERRQQRHLSLDALTALGRMVTSLQGQPELPAVSLPSYNMPPLPASVQPGKPPASPAAAAVDWKQQAWSGQPQHAQQLQLSSAQPASLWPLPADLGAEVVPCMPGGGRLDDTFAGATIEVVRHSAGSRQLAPSPGPQGLTLEEHFKLVQRVSDLEWLAWDQEALVARPDGAGHTPATLPNGGSRQGEGVHQQKQLVLPAGLQQPPPGTPAACPSSFLDRAFAAVPFPGSGASPVRASASASPAACSPQTGEKGLLPLPAAPCWPSSAQAPPPQPPVQQPKPLEWLPAGQKDSGRRHSPPRAPQALCQPSPSLGGEPLGRSVTPCPPPAGTNCRAASAEPPRPATASGWLLACPPGPSRDCNGQVGTGPMRAASLPAAAPAQAAARAASGASPFQEELLERASVLLFQATPDELAPHVRAGFTLLLHNHPGLLDDILSGEA